MISREDQTRITAVHYVSGSNTALFEIAISLGRIADMLAEMNDYIVEPGEQPRAAEAHDAVPSQLTNEEIKTIRIHINAFKEKLCDQRRYKEAEDYQQIVDKLDTMIDAEREEEWS